MHWPTIKAEYRYWEGGKKTFWGHFHRGNFSRKSMASGTPPSKASFRRHEKCGSVCERLDGEKWRCVRSPFPLFQSHLLWWGRRLCTVPDSQNHSSGLHAQDKSWYCLGLKSRCENNPVNLWQKWQCIWTNIISLILEFPDKMFQADISAACSFVLSETSSSNSHHTTQRPPWLCHM